jgi:hypothetical protein
VQDACITTPACPCHKYISYLDDNRFLILDSQWFVRSPIPQHCWKNEKNERKKNEEEIRVSWRNIINVNEVLDCNILLEVIPVDLDPWCAVNRSDERLI